DVFDIVSPAALTPIATYESSPLFRVALSPDDSRAYAVTFDRQLLMLDISTPTVVDLLQSLPIPVPSHVSPTAFTISPDGKLGFVGAGYRGLYIFDLTTDPTEITLLSSSLPEQYVHDIAISPDNRTAYLAIGGGVHVVDVSNPLLPLDLGSGGADA